MYVPENLNVDKRQLGFPNWNRGKRNDMVDKHQDYQVSNTCKENIDANPIS